MHRKRPIKLEVKNPSRGLVTRLPSDLADEMSEADLNRTFVAAQNVRFERGVVSAAPGHEVAALSTPFLTGCLAHWRMDDTANTNRVDSFSDHDFDVGFPLLSSDVAPTARAGRAWSLFGSDAKVAAGSTGIDAAILGAQKFTVVFWFHPTASLTSALVYGPGFEIEQVADSIRFTIHGSGGTIVVNQDGLLIGDWNYVCCWIDAGDNVQVQVNASGQGTSGFVDLVATGNPFQIRYDGFNGVDYSPAYFDSMTLWARSISELERQDIFNLGNWLDFPFVHGPWNLFFEANVLRDPNDPLLIFGTDKVHVASRTFTSPPRTFTLGLTEIYSGGAGDSEYRWSAVDYFDKVIFCQKATAPQYYITGSARPVPGLPTGTQFHGACAFYNHLLFWKDQTLTWSEQNDFSCWVPVANTIASVRLTLSANFLQPVVGVDTDWLPVTESPGALTIGQYVRIDDTQSSLPYYNFYLVSDISPFTGTDPLVLVPCAVSGNQTVAATATTKVFTKTQPAYEAGQRLKLGTNTQILTVDSINTPDTTSYVLDTDSVVANSFAVSFEETTANFEVGEVISLGSSADFGLDLYQITAVNVVSNTTLTLTKLFVGSSVKANGLTYNKSETYIIRQPWVKLVNPGSSITIDNTSSDAARTLTEQYAVKLTLQDFTGASATGATILAGKIIATLDANEAGTAQIVGGDDNGPIYQAVPMGEYAYLLRARSIQLLQFVGRQSGTFIVRTEVKNEGLISRHAFAKINNTRIVFLGNRELYDYQGGPTPTPVCMQQTRALFEELDRTRLDEIVLHHAEDDNQVWVCYPVIGGFKVLIWNYVENTATVDLYDAQNAFTASALVDWLLDPTWDQATLTWDGEDSTTAWEDLVGSGVERVNVFATVNGDTLVWGKVHNRDGAAFTCFAETKDFDMDDPSVFKYIDAIRLSLQVKVKESTTRNLYVQVGYRPDLDSEITWTSRKAVNVNGSNSLAAVVYPGGSGRFFRLRFVSDEVDVAWAVSGYSVYVRPGGTY